MCPARSAVHVHEDTNRPGLFYHTPSAEKGTGTIFVSLLREVPSKALTVPCNSALVCGWLKDQEGASPETLLSPSNFTECQAFRDTLNAVVREQAHVVDPVLETAARHQGEGWLHVVDERNPAPWGRIPDAEDIIGSVEVRDGLILPGSFQPMPVHRLVSSNGVFLLSKPLQATLLARLHELAQTA